MLHHDLLTDLTFVPLVPHHHPRESKLFEGPPFQPLRVESRDWGLALFSKLDWWGHSLASGLDRYVHRPVGENVGPSIRSYRLLSYGPRTR